MGKKHSEELSVKVVDYPNMVYASWTDSISVQDSVTKPRARRQHVRTVEVSSFTEQLPNCSVHDMIWICCMDLQVFGLRLARSTATSEAGRSQKR